jgi:hypothetical protein
LVTPDLERAELHDGRCSRRPANQPTIRSSSSSNGEQRGAAIEHWHDDLRA